MKRKPANARRESTPGKRDTPGGQRKRAAAKRETPARKKTRQRPPDLVAAGQLAAGGAENGVAAATPETAAADPQDAERSRKAIYARRHRADASNIGPPPPIDRPELREACRDDLVRWHQEVFPLSTGLKPFGPVQLDSIAVSKDTIEKGGKALKLEPRGYGKTTRTIQEVLWALCYGLRRYVVVFCSSTDKADEIVDGLRFELENNDILFGMFPEVCWPFRALEGKNQRAAGQNIDGEPTHVELKRDSIVFGYTPGSPLGGARISVKPFRNARGTQRRGAAGTERPDFIFLDDIQTDDSARFDTHVAQLYRKLRKSIARMGGHFNTLAAIMTATVIEPDDLADQMARDPAWLTVRYRMLASRSDAEDTWLGEYAELRRGYVAGDKKSKAKAAAKATAYYKANRAALDAGAVATWNWAYCWDDPEKSEISAIQHAYNIWIDDGEEAFFSECQNDPIRIDDDGENPKATREQLAASVIDLGRGVPPIDTMRLICHVDIHKRLLFFTVCAFWTDAEAGTFSAHVVDYGTWPGQAQRLFSVRNCKATIAKKYPRLQWKSAVCAATRDLISQLAEKQYKSSNGTPFSTDTILVDANWGPTEAEIKKTIREHAHRGKIFACHGKGIPAGKMPIEEWRTRPGEEKGEAWIRKRQGAKGVRTFIYDTNHWKTQTHIALQAASETKGTLTIFKTRDLSHELFFNHLLSEIATRQEGGGRVLYEWTNPPGGENHWFDNVVGCMAGASAEFTGRVFRRNAGAPRDKPRFTI